MMQMSIFVCGKQTENSANSFRYSLRLSPRRRFLGQRRQVNRAGDQQFSFRSSSVLAGIRDVLYCAVASSRQTTQAQAGPAMLSPPIADTDTAACASFFPLYTPPALRRQSLPRGAFDDR